ncbi:hypothetical protein ACFWF3_32135, partial [Nocardia sp. NPDC060220]
LHDLGGAEAADPVGGGGVGDEGDRVVIGSVDFLEIWDKQAWETYLEEHEEDYAQAGDESLGGIF